MPRAALGNRALVACVLVRSLVKLQELTEELALLRAQVPTHLLRFGVTVYGFEDLVLCDGITRSISHTLEELRWAIVHAAGVAVAPRHSVVPLEFRVVWALAAMDAVWVIRHRVCMGDAWSWSTTRFGHLLQGGRALRASPCEEFRWG